MRLPRPLFGVVRRAQFFLGAGPAKWHRDFFLQTVRENGFDVIHCHDLHTVPAGLALREKISPEAKVVYDSHELFACTTGGRLRERYWSCVEREYIAEVDLVITANESIACELARRYKINEPEVIYNSCEAEPEHPPLSSEAFRRHFGAPEGGFKVLFQGNLSDDRNLSNLVGAFAQLNGAAQLYLLGDGPANDTLQRTCRRRRTGNVFFGDQVPQDELLRYVARADLGVIPYRGEESLNHLYCTPNKLFEFIEAGVPVCASDLPELRRIVAENGIGAVHPMGTADQIAAAIRDCRVRCERGEFTAAARQAARETYSWKGQAKKLLAFYGQLEQ